MYANTIERNEYLYNVGIIRDLHNIINSYIEYPCNLLITLDAHSSPICSLCVMESGELCSLSDNGYLLKWNRHKIHLCSIFSHIRDREITHIMSIRNSIIASARKLYSNIRYNDCIYSYMTVNVLIRARNLFNEHRNVYIVDDYIKYNNNNNDTTTCLLHINFGSLTSYEFITNDKDSRHECQQDNPDIIIGDRMGRITLYNYQRYISYVSDYGEYKKVSEINGNIGIIKCISYLKYDKRDRIIASNKNIRIFDNVHSDDNKYNWNLIYTLDEHTESITCLLILSNGFLCSGSLDTTLKIWKIDNDNKHKNNKEVMLYILSFV